MCVLFVRTDVSTRALTLVVSLLAFFVSVLFAVAADGTVGTGFNK